VRVDEFERRQLLRPDLFRHTDGAQRSNLRHALVVERKTLSLRSTSELEQTGNYSGADELLQAGSVVDHQRGPT
jgi:hypothetical protein